MALCLSLKLIGDVLLRPDNIVGQGTADRVSVVSGFICSWCSGFCFVPNGPFRASLAIPVGTM
jgi:hypothetical protein